MRKKELRERAQEEAHRRRRRAAAWNTYVPATHTRTRRASIMHLARRVARSRERIVAKKKAAKCATRELVFFLPSSRSRGRKRENGETAFVERIDYRAAAGIIGWVRVLLGEGLGVNLLMRGIRSGKNLVSRGSAGSFLVGLAWDEV